MTIAEVQFPSRLTVVWVGEPPSDPTRVYLETLRFAVEVFPNGDRLRDDGFLAGVAAIVFAPNPRKPLSVIGEIETYVARLLDHDCRVFVFAPSAALESVKKVLTRLAVPGIWPAVASSYEAFDGSRTIRLTADPILPHVRVYRDAAPQEEIALLLLRFPAGPAPASPLPALFKLTGTSVSPLTEDERMMLRRAFFDCEEVFLKDMDEGKSGARVLHAYATLRREHAGTRVPYFVKIGVRNEIITEWANYDSRVRDNTPFHLAPRLLRERCALGARYGIIVGDFVEDSESLIECARSGRATIPIAALFERTLRGWHHHERPERHSVYREFQTLVAAVVPKNRLAKAMTLGATLTEAALRAKLRTGTKQRVAWGLIHGDLNASNVRVRGNDAILIDFFSTRFGIILSDYACMEASILLRVPKDDDFKAPDWKRVVDPLFAKEAFETVPSLCDPTERYAWLVGYVRQIRLRALSIEKELGQYSSVLAYRLFNAATKDPIPKASPEEDFRRAVAYVLADRLAKLVWSAP